MYPIIAYLLDKSIGKCVSVVEVLKREVNGIHQENKIFSTSEIKEKIEDNSESSGTRFKELHANILIKLAKINTK